MTSIGALGRTLEGIKQKMGNSSQEIALGSQKTLVLLSTAEMSGVITMIGKVLILTSSKINVQRLVAKRNADHHDAMIELQEEKYGMILMDHIIIVNGTPLSIHIVTVLVVSTETLGLQQKKLAVPVVGDIQEGF